MTSSSRPARSVLVEHGARHTRIAPGDEVFLSLPGKPANHATSCILTAPSGKTTTATPRQRGNGRGMADACVVATAEQAGRWRYSWQAGRKRISGVFHVSHPGTRKQRTKS